MSDRSALTLRTPHALPEPNDALARTANENIQAFIDGIGDGTISHRQAVRIGRNAETARVFGEHVTRIVAQGLEIARASATCARDVERLATEIDALHTQRAENARRREELDAETEHIGAVVGEEFTRRKLVAQVEAAELGLRLRALNGEAAPCRATPPSAPQCRTVQTPDITAATLERLQEEAARIVREVQAGSVPTGARHPYHAFAASLYLRARLDDLDARAAAMHARTEVVSHMLHGAEFTPSQLRDFARECKDLKKRLDAAADSRRSASVLASLQRMGASIPSNGGVQ